jgi:hypothetical protein
MMALGCPCLEVALWAAALEKKILEPAWSLPPLLFFEVSDILI